MHVGSKASGQQDGCGVGNGGKIIGSRGFESSDRSADGAVGGGGVVRWGQAVARPEGSLCKLVQNQDMDGTSQQRGAQGRAHRLADSRPKQTVSGCRRHAIHDRRRIKHAAEGSSLIFPGLAMDAGRKLSRTR